MTDPATMKAAKDAVLLDANFARAPVLTRLLNYLVEMTLKGEGPSLKSYSVAVDGLGRPADGDAQIDTYARVQVGRLRKALEAHYAGPGRDRSHRLVISNGSYEVNLVPVEEAGNRPSHASPRATGASLMARYRGVIAAALVTLAILVFATFQYRERQSDETEQWRNGNFPIVAIATPRDPRASNRALANSVRQSLLKKLELYEGVRVAYSASGPVDYFITPVVEDRGGSRELTLMVVDQKADRLIWSTGSRLTSGILLDDSVDDFLARSVFQLAQPSGVIHANERRRVYALNSPYGCWLRYTGRLQNNHVARDEDLHHCAKDWYEAAPNHPGAAGVHGWTLVDQSIFSLTDVGRQAQLKHAIETMEAARLVHPDSPLLQFSLMRAYAFAGDRKAALAAGEKALRLNRENIDILGGVGTFMVMQGDLRGEALVDKAIARHFNPPPWYFSGKFAAALLRDDPSAARVAHSRMLKMSDARSLVAVLAAAMYARSGSISLARAKWEQAEQQQPLIRLAPDRFLARLPIAPSVRVPLRRWLDPVID